MGQLMLPLIFSAIQHEPGTVSNAANKKLKNTSKAPTHGAHILKEKRDNMGNKQGKYIARGIELRKLNKRVQQDLSV